MIYFLKKNITGINSLQLEMSMRKAALKRNASLDLSSSIINIGVEKTFLGYESKNGLTFTRIKASVEKFLPKVIIKIEPGSENINSQYAIRLSAVSLIVFLVFNLSLLIALLIVIIHQNNVQNILGAAVVTMFYWLLLIIEIKLTQLKIKQTAKNYTSLIV